jgi:hypothetical protein
VEQKHLYFFENDVGKVKVIECQKGKNQGKTKKIYDRPINQRRKGREGKYQNHTSKEVSRTLKHANFCKNFDWEDYHH